MASSENAFLQLNLQIFWEELQMDFCSSNPLNAFWKIFSHFMNLLVSVAQSCFKYICGNPALMNAMGFCQSLVQLPWCSCGQQKLLLCRSFCSSCSPRWLHQSCSACHRWASNQCYELSGRSVIHHISGRISNYCLSIKPSVSAYKHLVMQSCLHLKLANLFGEPVNFHMLTKFLSYKKPYLEKSVT